MLKYLKNFSFLDKITVLLLSLLLVCLGMLAFRMNELDKVEDKLKSLKLDKARSIEARLDEMIRKMEVQDGRPGTVKSSTKESPRNQDKTGRVYTAP